MADKFNEMYKGIMKTINEGRGDYVEWNPKTRRYEKAHTYYDDDSYQDPIDTYEYGKWEALNKAEHGIPLDNDELDDADPEL